MKKLALGLTAATAIALAGVAALAQPAPGPMDPMAGKTVTKAEAQAMAADMFAKMDVNGDGKLDKADREARRAQRQAERFGQLDTDKNGAISREEFAAGHARRGDGPDGKGPGHWGHGDKGDKHDMGGRMGHGGGMMMLHMADANKDGAISKDEFLAAHAKHFDQADANKDGKLTPEERKAAHEKMRAMMGKMRGGHDGHGEHEGHGKRGGMMPPPPPPPAN